jgi:hypothetical protein
MCGARGVTPVNGLFPSPPDPPVLEHPSEQRCFDRRNQKGPIEGIGTVVECGVEDRGNAVHLGQSGAGAIVVSAYSQNTITPVADA